MTVSTASRGPAAPASHPHPVPPGSPEPLAPPVTPVAETSSTWGDRVALLVWLSCALVLGMLLLKDLLGRLLGLR
jgi:hypothetical protein